MVVSELRGEKIDIIPHNDEPARFVAKALSPARVREVLVADEEKQATVIVPDDQLSLAIGRDGQNARLAARLTGWKVDIKSETEFSEEEGEIEYEGEEGADGRCAAVLTTGRRCPNAALQGSAYCGLPTHQALARFKTSQVAVLSAVTEEEIAKLADPEANEGELKEIIARAESEFDEAAAAKAEADAEAAEAAAAQEAADAEAAEAAEEAETEGGDDADEAPEAEADEETEDEAEEVAEAETEDEAEEEAEETEEDTPEAEETPEAADASENGEPEAEEAPAAAEERST